MRKFTILITIALFCIFNTLSAQSITESFSFENPEIITNDDGFSYFEFPNCNNYAVEGNPLLAFYSVDLLIPQGEIIKSVKIISISFSDELNDIRILPASKPFPTSQKVPDDYKPVPNQKIYSSDNVYPNNSVASINTQFLSGHSIGSFSICPVQYFPASNTVKFIENIVVEVETVEDTKAQSAINFLNKNSIIESRIKQIVENPEMLDNYSYDTDDEDDTDLLLITKNSFIPAFEDFVAFKESTGFVVNIVSTEDVYSNYSGQDNQEKIRNCIIDYYENHGITFVILGGDADPNNSSDNIVPHRGFYADSDDDIPSDMYYSCLDGSWNNDGDNKWGELGETDLYAEVGIGRICADNTSEIENFTNKLILYQNNPVIDDIENTLLIGEELNNNPWTYGGDYMDEIIGGSSANGITTVGVPTDYSIFELYDRDGGWSKNDVFSKINNDGVHLMNHLGHSNVQYNMKMENPDLTTTNFQNDGITRSYVIGYSQGCYNGSFDNRKTDGGYYSSDCFAEKITTIATAEVACIANSRYGWYMPGGTNSTSQFVHRQFIDAIFGEDIFYIGHVNSDSKEDNASIFNSSGNMRWVVYQTNLFGDPSLDIWTASPTDFIAQYPASIPIGLSQVSVQTDAAFARVALFQDGVLIGRALADASGNASVNMFSPITSPLPVSISIIGHNKNRLQDNIIVVSDEPYIIFNSQTLNDESGNGNGLLDYNESVLLSVGLNNVGNQPTSSVVATLSTDNPYVSITDNNEPYGDFDPEEIIFIDDAFAFSVSANVPDGEIILFEISAESGETIWESSFSITAHAPDLSISDFEILGNGGIDPGETTEVSITLNNCGSSGIIDAIASVTSASPYLTINTGSQNIGDINSDDNVEVIFSITASSNTPIGQVVDLIFDLSAENEFSFNETLYLTVGLIFEDFETGDFSSFDWSFSGNADWQIINSGAYEGDYCAKTGSIGNNSESILVLELEVLSAGEISFFKKVSCEDDPGGTGYDYLAFSIDNNEKGKWDGEVSWSEEVFTVSAGTHTFKWTYHKDGYVTGGSDCAWIDYVILPPIQPDEFTQAIPLNAGYQFVSSRIDVVNPDMLVVFQDILNDNLDFVRNSEGVILRKIGPNWVNGIGDWISTEGYLIKMYGAEILALTGDIVNPTNPISLTMGYQFVSFLPEVSIDAIVAFEGILTNDLDYIRNSNGEMLRKIGPNWVNGIGDANPGEGYLIKMYADDLLVYNIPTEITKSSTLDKLMNHFTFEGGNAADPVYSIYVSGLNIGDEVAVFDGEKMVGASVVISENVLENSVPVFSTVTEGKGYEANNPISIIVWDSQKQIEVSATYTFSDEYVQAYTKTAFPESDGEFSVINVSKNSFRIETNSLGISVFPNPVTDVLNISSEYSIKRITILNFVGQTMFDNEINNTITVINTSNLQSGIYFIRIETSAGLKTEKLTVY